MPCSKCQYILWIILVCLEIGRRQSLKYSLEQESNVIEDEINII